MLLLVLLLLLLLLKVGSMATSEFCCVAALICANREQGKRLATAEPKERRATGT